ncbi:alpha/beta fold hydrolase [Paenibacillus sp. CAU 1782]
MTVDILKRNYVKVTGTGEQTLVFAHGFGCDQDMWRHIVPAFEQNYRIVLFDYVGSGKSQLDLYDHNKYNDLKGYAQDVLDVLEALELKNTIFVGHSVSGMIGMLASICNPDYFSNIIMIGSSPRYMNEQPGYYGGFDKKDIDELLNMMQLNFIGWASYLAPIVMQNNDRKELTEELEQTFCSRDPHIARQFAEVTFYSDCRSRLDEASVPTLILQCSDDSISPVEVGQYLHAHLKNSKLHQMSAKGHYPQLSHPGEMIQCLKDYLTGA